MVIYVNATQKERTEITLRNRTEIHFSVSGFNNPLPVTHFTL